MSKKFLWEVVYSEKYTTKDWTEKTKYTNVWWLFQDTEKWFYSIKFLWGWLNVFEKKDKPTENKNTEILDDDIPF